ncbi:peroxiredoxin [Vibrio coralliilyticus]|uniref:peroxiredoxin n=1 Tax=Vibrio coralliilyticus TaxID=190893 RepID=UPI0006CDDE19|nr:peroxiredoxin [Vibrio coralliilyticus]AXN34817.1 peroxiredoxin [Vibrio coralliilyticus]KPH24994.1 thioredoxin peroxidase [Vibrio coralliilyticus]
MKRTLALLAMITTGWAHAGFDVTQASAGLGTTHSVTLEHNTSFSLGGHAVKVGDRMPAMTLASASLAPIQTQGSGKVRIYNVLVSVDTPVCVEQAVAFDQLAATHKAYADRIDFMTVSADTPFAQARFIAEQKLSNGVSFVSDSRQHEFGQQTGAHIEELGLLSRAIIVVGKDDRILHIQRVPELTQLPDLNAALDIAKRHI